MFQWSSNAAHIQTLFVPWQPSNGFAQEDLASAEAQLDLQLPALLRSFYHSWGKRADMTRQVERLLSPSQLFIQSDALVLCVENQAVWYWAIPRAALHEADPPVVVARNEQTNLCWQPSHDRLSDFLDYLTYGHAIDGGALHGGYSQWLDSDSLILLREHFDEILLPSYPYGLMPGITPRPWSLFVGEGFVLSDGLCIGAATRTSAMLDQIQDVVQITWRQRW